MKHFFFCLVLFLCTLFAPSYSMNAQGEIISASVKGEIDRISVFYVNQVFQEAEQQKASAVLLSLDTPGGDAAAAMQIRDILLESPRPVIVYISSRAWSAGALIALAGTEIYMAPGSSIGAAEPIPATEKNISAIRSELRSTAEYRKRNGDLAAAMADASLGYSPYAEKGQIVTLTDRQAQETGLSAGSASTEREALSGAGLADHPVVPVKDSFLLTALRILNHPVTEAVLAAVILIAVLAEIKTAGFSGGGLLAVLAGILLIGGQWYLGESSMVEAVLYFGGMALIFLDLLLLGTGVAAAAGVIALAAGLYFTFGGNASALMIVSSGLLAGAVGFYFLAQYLPESRIWKKIRLADQLTSDRGYVSNAQDLSSYLQAEGYARSVLRPAGTAVIHDRMVDVVTEGEFVNPGTPVKVVKITGGHIVVRPIQK